MEYSLLSKSFWGTFHHVSNLVSMLTKGIVFFCLSAHCSLKIFHNLVEIVGFYNDAILTRIVLLWLYWTFSATMVFKDLLLQHCIVHGCSYKLFMQIMLSSCWGNYCIICVFFSRIILLKIVMKFLVTVKLMIVLMLVLLIPRVDTPILEGNYAN